MRAVNFVTYPVVSFASQALHIYPLFCCIVYQVIACLGHLAYAFNAWSIKMLICILCLCERWEEKSEESYSLVRRVALLWQHKEETHKDISQIYLVILEKLLLRVPRDFSCDHAPTGHTFHANFGIHWVTFPVYSCPPPLRPCPHWAYSSCQFLWHTLCEFLFRTFLVELLYHLTGPYFQYGDLGISWFTPTIRVISPFISSFQEERVLLGLHQPKG